MSQQKVGERTQEVNEDGAGGGGTGALHVTRPTFVSVLVLLEYPLGGQRLLNWTIVQVVCAST